MARRVFLFIITNILVVITLQIVATLVLSFLGAGSLITSPAFQGLIVWAVVWGFGGAFISLAISRLMAKWMMGVKVIDPNTQNSQERQLVQTVYGLAQRAGLPKMPEVGYYESPELNAFATGPSKRRSLVAVSTGLLQSMNADQIEGVLGHEITHISNGDMVTMTLIQGVVNSFVLFFSRIIASIIGQQVEERMRFVVEFVASIVLQILFGLLGSLLVNYFSQRREFRADAGGAALAGKRKMISALQGLARVHLQQAPLEDQQPALATLKISSSGGGLLSKIMSTHPPLEERIRRLEELPTA
jgi:heat shock protein HtpX